MVDFVDFCLLKGQFFVALSMKIDGAWFVSFCTRQYDWWRRVFVFFSSAYCNMLRNMYVDSRKYCMSGCIVSKRSWALAVWLEMSRRSGAIAQRQNNH